MDLHALSPEESSKSVLALPSGRQSLQGVPAAVLSVAAGTVRVLRPDGP
jgi:hypothetical protein